MTYHSRNYPLTVNINENRTSKDIQFISKIFPDNDRKVILLTSKRLISHGERRLLCLQENVCATDSDANRDTVNGSGGVERALISLTDLKSHVTVLTASQVAYTRKRGAGVKNYSLVGETKGESPMQALLRQLSITAQAMRQTMSDNSLLLSMATESPLHDIQLPLELAAPLSFRRLIHLERIMTNITRFLDDRASMLRRGGDEVSVLTAAGTCLLLQDIADTENSFAAALLSVSVNVVSQKIDTLHCHHGSSTTLPIVVAAASSASATDVAGLDPMSTTPLRAETNRVRGRRGTGTQTQISDSIADTSDMSRLRIRSISGTAESLERRLRFWLGPVPRDGGGGGRGKQGGLAALRVRVEAGLSALLDNSVQARCGSTPFLKSHSFLVHSKRVRVSKDFFSAVVIPEQKSSALEPEGIVQDLCKTILTPFLEHAKRLCRSSSESSQSSSSCLQGVVSVAVNAVLTSLLKVVLGRRLPFNEGGIVLLHNQIQALQKWVGDAKKELSIPPGRHLVLDLAPWYWADAVLQTLQRACSGSSVVIRPSETTTTTMTTTVTGEVIKAQSKVVGGVDQKSTQVSSKKSFIFFLCRRARSKHVNINWHNHKSVSLNTNTHTQSVTNPGGKGNGKAVKHKDGHVNGNVNNSVNVSISSPRMFNANGNAFNGRRKKRLLPAKDQEEWASLAEGPGMRGLGLGLGLGRLVPMALRAHWRRRKGMISGSLELDLSVL